MDIRTSNVERHADSEERQSKPAPPCPDIVHIDKLTILGVDINSNLTYVGCRSCQQSSCFLLQSAVYALCVLIGATVSPTSHVKDVFQATVVGKLMYRAPAWYGFCSATDYVRLKKTHICVDAQSSVTQSNQLLLLTCCWKPMTRCSVKYCTPKHTFYMHSYLPDRPELVYSLRTRSHNKSLICKTRKRAIAKALQLKGHSDFAPVDTAYYHHSVYFFVRKYCVLGSSVCQPQMYVTWRNAPCQQ